MSDSPVSSTAPSSASQSPAPLQYVSQAGEEVLAPVAANAHLLQQASEYYSGTRLLRTSGVWDLVWGFSALLLTVLLVLSPIQIGPMRLPLILAAGTIAAVMIAAGCWLVFAPSPGAMIVDGVCLILIAITNISWFVYDMTKPQAATPQSTGPFSGSGAGARGGSSYLWLMLFAFTILGAVSRFRRYGRFKAASMIRPSKRTMNWLNETRRFLKQANHRTTPTFIQFDAGNTFPPISARGYLLADLAVLLINRERFQFVAEPDLSITPIKPMRPDKKGKATINLQGKTFTATVSIETVQRCDAWKNATEAEVEFVEPAEGQPPRDA